MVLLHTPQRDENFQAPPFALRNINNQTLNLDQIKGENGTFLMFICNHCPYVIAIIDRLVESATRLQKNGIGCAAIMPNDTQKYPADSFENMQKFANEHHFTFPYLIDETQEVAKAYNAVCTPDFFAFDASNKLYYRGRLDSAKNKEADNTTIAELENALMGMIKNTPPPEVQHPSMGCSIKWR